MNKGEVRCRREEEEGECERNEAAVESADGARVHTPGRPISTFIKYTASVVFVILTNNNQTAFFFSVTHVA